jgi:hypothetical protein
MRECYDQSAFEDVTSDDFHRITNSNRKHLYPMMRNVQNIALSIDTLANPLKGYKTAIKAAFILLVCIGLFPLISSSQIAQRGTATTATSTTTSVTVAKPLGLTVGDFMIATINQADNDGNSLADATNTGWTLVNGAMYYATGNNEWWGTVLYKVADATDVVAADFVFTGDGNADDMQAGIVAFSGVDPSNPIDVAGTFTSSTNSDPNLSAKAIGVQHLQVLWRSFLMSLLIMLIWIWESRVLGQ